MGRPFTFNASGAFAGARVLLAKIRNADFSPLMERWEVIMAQDNRRGVLAGLDKDGQPLIPVTYRPITPNPPRPTSRQTNNRNRLPMGFGPAAAGLHNNLTFKEYQRLGGPPLAPRGPFSRVITNLVTRSGRRSGSIWYAAAAWMDIVSTKGRPFLRAHLLGLNGLPKRNIAGVRPEGRREAQTALRAFVARLVYGR